MGTTTYRFVVVNPAATTPFAPGDLVVSDEHWWVTSLRGGTRPFIESPPWGDGQEVDLLTGKTTDGACRVRVIDIPGATVGGAAVNEEFDDNLLTIINRGWSLNYAGLYPGDNWVTGLVSYAPGAGTGVIVSGGQLVAIGDQSNWMARTFTAADGIVPLTTYTVRCLYVNFGCTYAFPWFGNGANPPVPFLESQGTRVHGSQYWTPFNVGRPPQLMQVVATSDASGNLRVLIGYDQLKGACGFAIGFDWVHITPGSPALIGPYSTVHLADSNARQQFLGRAAYVEASYDLGASWPQVQWSGYITDIQLPLSLVYEYGIGDARRAERITKAFVQPTVHFDNVTPLIGGPALNGWDPLLPFFGRPRFTIEAWTPAVFVGSDMTEPGEVLLRYRDGPMPEAYKATGDNLTRSNFDVINQRAATFWVPDASVPSRTTAIGQVGSAGSFPRLVAKIYDINGDFNTGPDSIADKYTPWSWFYAYFGSPPPWHVARFVPRDAIMSEGGRIRLPWTYGPLVPGPNIGGVVELAIYPKNISEEYPLHITMHPVDIVRFLYTDYGIPFDTTSADDTKNALGPQLEERARVKASESIQEYIEKLFGAYGFSTRMQNGQRVFFTLRRKASTSPTVTITTAELREEGGPTFDLSESTKCNQVRFTQTRFVHTNDTAVETRPWDDITEVRQEVVADLVTAWPGRGDPGPGGGGVVFPIGYIDPTLDSAVFGERVQDFSIPGQLYIQNVGELSALAFTRGLSETVFDRAGRGAQATTLVTRRGAGVDDLQVGDEVGVDIPHHPNAQLGRTPSSQRGGTRVATVIRREEQPEGIVYSVVDAGTGTIPANITPLAGDFVLSVDPLDSSVIIFDIAPTGATRHFAADLVVANARIELQIAFSALAPTTDGIHYTTIDPAEYSFNSFAPQLGGDYKIRIGPFPTTVAMWGRIRTFVPGTTPSIWSSWTNIGGGLPPGSGDISALIIGPETDTTIPLAWTNTDTVNPVTVYLADDGLNNWVLVATLLPGSTQYTITGLTPGTDYDIRVILAATGTALNGDATTTNSGLSTLPAPVSPVAFTGSNPNVPPGTGTGIYGMKAIGLVTPSVMIFEYADETAVGSGIPGTFREWTREPTVASGYTTSQSNSAANDGKLRYVRAKLRASGYNDSPYTTPIGIDPWLAGVITPGLPGTIPVLPIPAPPGSPGVPGSPIPIPIPPTRFISPISITGLASGATGTGLVTVGKGSICYRVAANSPCRVRLYDSAAERTTDAARAIDTDAVSGKAPTLEVVLHPTDTMDLKLTPRIVLGSAERPPLDHQFYAVTNLLGSTADILVELDLTPNEN